MIPVLSKYNVVVFDRNGFFFFLFFVTGNYFVTGSADQMVKVWLYKESVPTHVGVGHAGIVTNVKVSPDCQMVVSTSTNGDIFLWRFPYDADVLPPQDTDDAAAKSTRSACSLRDRQTDRSRELSQKKAAMPVRAENIKAISKKQKVRINLDTGDCTNNVNSSEKFSGKGGACNKTRK